MDYWQTDRANTVAAWDAFLKLHPKSPLAAEAEERRDLKAAAESMNPKALIRSFLSQHPNGIYTYQVLRYLCGCQDGSPRLLHSFMG